jgi:hypothetical protein
MEYNYARRQAYFDNHQYLGRLDILINSKVSHHYRAEQMNSWMVSCIKWFKHKQYTKMGCSTKWYKKEDQRNPSLGSKLSITIYWRVLAKWVGCSYPLKDLGRNKEGSDFLDFKPGWDLRKTVLVGENKARIRTAIQLPSYFNLNSEHRTYH